MTPGIIASAKGPCEDSNGLGAGLVAAGRTLGGRFTGPGAAVVASGSGMKGAGTVGVAAWGLPGVELPGGSAVEWQERFALKIAKAELWGWPKRSGQGPQQFATARLAKAAVATTEVTNNRRKTGKRPSATRFKARGRDSICLKGSSAPGILLKAIPSLRPPGHEVILARGHPKAIRSCLQWSERETPTGLCLLLQCVRWRACGFEDQMCIVEYRA